MMTNTEHNVRRVQSWIKNRTMTLREIASRSGLTERNLLYACKPGWNPKACTLIALERVMDETPSLDCPSAARALPGVDTPAEAGGNASRPLDSHA
jgi:transcriptional regulator with XRE-family HTH domain